MFILAAVCYCDFVLGMGIKPEILINIWEHVVVQYLIAIFVWKKFHLVCKSVSEIG